MPLTDSQYHAALNGAPGTVKATPPPSAATPTPQPQTLPSHAAPVAIGKDIFSKALAPLIPPATGAVRVAGTGVGRVFDVLNRPSAANQARILRGPKAGAQALIHSETPEQYTADTAELARRDMANTRMFSLSPLLPSFGPQTGRTMTKEEYDKQPGWWHQAVELVTQIKHDPMTYAGGAGILSHLGEAIGSKSVIGLSRAVEGMLASANPQVRSAGKGLASAFDVTHYKGATQRALAAKYGDEGLHYFRGLKAINNARRTKAGSISNELLNKYHDTTHGLNEAQESQLYDAIHNGTVAQLPPVLAKRAVAFKQVTDSLAHLEGTGEVRRQLGGQGFELGKGLKPFEGSEPRGLQGSESFREHYMPTKHRVQKSAEEAPPTSILGLDQPATADSRSLADLLRSPIEDAERTTPGLKSEDANLLQRGEGAKLLGPALQRRVIAARLKGGAQAIAAHDAEGKVAELFGKKVWSQVPNDARAFFQETWKEPGGAEFWGGLFKKGIDIPKAALFALPFRHMANISSLSFLADPSLQNVFGTAGRFMRLIIARDPEVRAKIMGKAGEYGIGASSFDRKPGWVGHIPLLGNIYKASNHTLWTFDDAAKATRFDRLLKAYKTEGMDESHAAYKAADQVGAEMVDYSNSSPLTETLRYILPFASWRTKFPLAVAHSVSRHPEVATNIGRVAPEEVGDVQESPGLSQYGEQKGSKSNLPLAEMFRGAENRWEFGRASLGYPAQMAASMIGIHGDDYKNYMTYGKDPDLKYLLNATLGQFPGASAGLGKAGLGEFKTQGDITGSIGQQLGHSMTHGPSPAQMATQLYIQEKLGEINAAHRNKQAALVESLESDLKYYLKNHEQYEK